MHDAIQDHPSPATAAGEQRLRHGTAAFRRTSLSLFAASFATFGLLYAVQPLLPEFSRAFHLGAGASAWALSSTSAVLAISLLLLGMFADGLDRKRVMAVALLVSAVLSLASAMAPNWPVFLGLRSLLGLSLSGLPAVGVVYLNEELHAESLGLGVGLYISGNALGGMSGRLVAGVVDDYWGWRAGIATMGLIGLIAALLFCIGLPPSRHHHRRRRPGLVRLKPRGQTLFSDRGLSCLFALGFILMGVFVAAYNSLGYRLLAPPFELSQTVTGLIFCFYLVGSFSSAWMGAQAGRLGAGRVLWRGFALMLLGVLLTVADRLWLTVMGIVAITFGFFGAHAVASAWVGQRAGIGKAQASACYLFAYYLGGSIVGVFGGLAYSHAAWCGVAWLLGGLLLLGLGMAGYLGRISRSS